MVVVVVVVEGPIIIWMRRDETNPSSRLRSESYGSKDRVLRGAGFRKKEGWRKITEIVKFVV